MKATLLFDLESSYSLVQVYIQDMRGSNEFAVDFQTAPHFFDLFSNSLSSETHISEIVRHLSYTSFDREMLKELFKPTLRIEPERAHVFFAIFLLQIEFQEKFMIFQKNCWTQNILQSYLNMIQAADSIYIWYFKN